ncbi:hypothetical protein [Sandaracinus amylolyticus]|uniref:hypothetical protein n=1 Tax=Sandaracinus amylolyticus TaxID=927083 RepID=UPI001F42D869|nr:hypothetical protein [Sandaracinus amylolyticus]UJR86149.1 Hypothetical protein I5071_82310 [Sandaracinus amylolyticus]
MRAVLALAVLALGCASGELDRTRFSSDAGVGDGSIAQALENEAALARRRDAIDPEDAERYARRLAPMLVRRSLRESEIEQLERGGTALAPVIDAWLGEPGLERAARDMISTLLGTSGWRDGIDLNLPGNLAAYLARANAPWSGILTTDHCVDVSGAAIACDTGAPYAAGVITTRAFLAGNNSRYNLRRARTLMRRFVCVDYPISDEMQPRLERELLIPMFRATSAEDQTEDAARAGFGNGLACYTCHGQFGAHAQLFVRYDRDGRYRADATGVQLAGGELGVSDVEGLYASHFVAPERARDERTEMLGQEVASLPDAARVIASSAAFLPCATRHLLAYGFDLAEPGVQTIDARTIEEIVRDAGPDPSLRALARAAFLHPDVIRAAIVTPEAR